jgi:hypothetical protein
VYIKIFYPILVVWGCCAALKAQTGCIESVQVDVVPVQCYSFRNGSITIASVQGGTSPYYYSIDGTTFSTRPEFEFLWPGIYEIIIRDSVGCIFTKEVEVEEPPVLEVSLLTTKSLVELGESFRLEATVSPPDAHIASVQWRPPDMFGEGITLAQFVEKINETTTFAVEIIDQNGCTARDQVTVAVKLPNIYAPNIISIGSNQDAFFTLFTDEYVSIIKSLNIYSRTGSLVFSRTNFPPNDPLLGWGGRYNEKRVQPGVFTWVAEVADLDGKVRLMYGSLTVVR